MATPRPARIVWWIGPCLAAAAAHAEVFRLEPGQDMVGTMRETRASAQDTLADIARRYHLGFDEIGAANPGVDMWLPGKGTRVRLPTEHILPNAPRVGIVVNLPEGRLYYFHDDRNLRPVVETFPISVGQMDWNTPLGVTKIVRKEKMPTWYPPKSVRATHLKDGDVLPAAIAPGPNNPLGRYALRLGIPGGAYLIHGTNNPVGVGMQITHGCIRLYPEDIDALFHEAPVGTAVRIVNQRIMTGWADGALYLEVHHPLDDADPKIALDPTALTRTIVEATARRRVIIDWHAAQRVFEQQRGEPIRISVDRWRAPAAVAGPRQK